MAVSGGIELVCFDLGRVLVRICNDWRHACTVAGVTVPDAGFGAETGARLHSLVCEVEVGRIDHDGFCRGVSSLVGLSPRDVSALSDAYTIGTYPGAVDLLDALRDSSVPTACLSNTNANHWRILGDPSSHCPFPFDRIDHAFASHLLRLRKPDEAIYAHVERTTGSQPSGIVFFDDVPENIAAAKTRGWMAYHVDPASDNPIPQIRATLRSHGLCV
jgi:putative hydrolase of the HAD superfamily